MTSTAAATTSGGMHKILGATMFASRYENSSESPLGATLLFCVLGLALSLLLVGLPQTSGGTQEYASVFVAAHLE